LYLAFLGKPRGNYEHHHATPWSMLVPLVILGLLSICGGWIGIERFAGFLAPSVGAPTIDLGGANLELILSIAAVSVAILGWFVAHLFYKQGSDRPVKLATAFPAGYRVLIHKYYVDEIYGAIVVQPLLIISRYLLEGFVDKGVLGGSAWLLAGTAKFSGALLQRWQSGNLRSYAAWLAAGAAAVLLFLVVPWSTVMAVLTAFHFGGARH
jgi:NADH-quinone oxidoreductase subunit L